MYYATLMQARAYLKLDTAETGDDALLTDFIRYACRYCDTRAGTRFYPELATRYFDVPSGGKLQFDDHLLELTSVTNGDGEAIALTNLIYYPATLYPRYGISIKAGASQSWAGTDDGDRAQAIALAGVWGYHDDYPNAWASSLDAVADAGGINASVTTVNFTSSTLASADGQTPRFQAGQLWKIDNEFFDVVSVGATSAVTKRAAYGSTAAAHLTAAPISIWRPMANITFAVLRLVAWRYRQKDANVFDATTILGTGVKITPSAVPPDVDDLIPQLIHLAYGQ